MSFCVSFRYCCAHLFPHASFVCSTRSVLCFSCTCVSVLWVVAEPMIFFFDGWLELFFFSYLITVPAFGFNVSALMYKSAFWLQYEYIAFFSAPWLGVVSLLVHAFFLTVVPLHIVIFYSLRFTNVLKCMHGLIVVNVWRDQSKARRVLQMYQCCVAFYYWLFQVWDVLFRSFSFI